MKSQLGHLQININPQNLSFYKELFAFLGWKPLHEDETMVGLSSELNAEVSVWFMKGQKEISNDYDGIGLNHLALSVPNQADVDAAKDYLEAAGTKLLFDTPKHRPEFAWQEGDTYYQIMFETPDKILFEIVYTGPKS